jgi:hypothetical protein
MMEMEEISETLVFNSTLTQLNAQKDFNTRLRIHYRYISALPEFLKS